MILLLNFYILYLQRYKLLKLPKHVQPPPLCGAAWRGAVPQTGQVVEHRLTLAVRFFIIILINYVFDDKHLFSTRVSIELLLSAEENLK